MGDGMGGVVSHILSKRGCEGGGGVELNGQHHIVHLHLSLGPPRMLCICLRGPTGIRRLIPKDEGGAPFDDVRGLNSMRRASAS